MKKNNPIAVIMVGLGLCSSVFNGCIQVEDKSSGTSLSQLNGAWELYATESEGKTTLHKQPWQIKVHADGYQSMMQYDEDGKFSFACAGTYELDGEALKETFTHHSYEPWIGVSMWWNWSLSPDGDTAYFSGPNKIVTADGSDITHEWKAKIFEKKVRVK